MTDDDDTPRKQKLMARQSQVLTGVLDHVTCTGRVWEVGNKREMEAFAHESILSEGV